jgi:hypothetical protein
MNVYGKSNTDKTDSDNIDLMESNGIELISLIQVTKPVLVIFRFFNVDTDLIYIINVLGLICQGIPKHVVRFHHVSICFHIFLAWDWDHWDLVEHVGTNLSQLQHLQPQSSSTFSAKSPQVFPAEIVLQFFHELFQPFGADGPLPWLRRMWVTSSSEKV